MNHQHTKEDWRKMISPYEKPNLKKSLWQLCNTLIPFFASWYATYWSLSVSYVLTLVLAGLTAGLTVRIFIIFHDCCHGSFFANRKWNEIVGTLTGILTFSPFHQWRYSHARHHATSGNLDHHGDGDIWTLTVEEYLELPRHKRLAYRLYRNPLIMFGLGPIYVFLIKYRFNRKNAKRKERINTYVINVSIFAISLFLCWLIGWKEFLLVQGPIFYLSSLSGVWLFYVQHQFEDAYFEHQENWNFVDAALKGSSFYNLPGILHWFTGDIGYHHIHHLSSRVPNYHLAKAHHENQLFQPAQSITLRTSLQSLRFRMWDENRKKLVGFQYVKQFLKKKEAKQSFQHPSIQTEQKNSA